MALLLMIEIGERPTVRDAPWVTRRLRRRSSGRQKDQFFHAARGRAIVRAAIASGKIHGHETVTAAVTLSSEKLGLDTTIYTKIEL